MMKAAEEYFQVMWEKERALVEVVEARFKFLGRSLKEELR